MATLREDELALVLRFNDEVTVAIATGGAARHGWLTEAIVLEYDRDGVVGFTGSLANQEGRFARIDTDLLAWQFTGHQQSNQQAAMRRRRPAVVRYSVWRKDFRGEWRFSHRDRY